MVVALHDTEAQEHRFELRPNQSLTVTGAIVFYSAVSTVILGIAGGFAYAGLWLVLPFAGLELVGLGAALGYLLNWRSREREFIVVDHDNVRIARGWTGKPVWCGDQFQRGWAQIRLERSPVRSYPNCLVIRSHGRRREIGAFLTDAEREQLAHKLRLALLWEQPVPAG